MLDEPLAVRLDGTVETVGEALQNAMSSLTQISDILDNTRKLVAHEIRREDFESTELRNLFARDIIPLHARTFPILLDCPAPVRVRLHRPSFVEAINNIIRNAEMHGFPDGTAGAELLFRVTERRMRIVIDYTNNGRPFPGNLSAHDFLAFGVKSGESPGEGLGGAWIGKVIAAHSGRFEIVRDEHPVHFRISLSKGGA
jgi:nitrogen fixation/metabolism regulation signal transduction histidine kinase